MNISDGIRKKLRIVIFILVLASMYFGLSAMYIDLYNPGSLEARELNTIVNYIFGITVLLSLPLLIEKLKWFSTWEDKYNTSDDATKTTMIKAVAYPILKKIGMVLVLTVIAAFVLQSYWQLTPETIANYQAYYSSPKYPVSPLILP